jgi:RHS repeat-associated protein
MPPQGPSLITRLPGEVFGTHPAYGMAGYGVNTATGNFTLTSADLVFHSGPLGLLSWTRTYNSFSTGTGTLGPGWVTAFSARLAVTRTGLLRPGESVAFHDEDGRVLTFTRQADGTFTRPADLDADLTQNADGSFTLRFFSGEAWTFNLNGRLTARSREGQSVTLNYDIAGRPLTAVHSRGRRLSFSYDAHGRLTSAESDDGRVVTYAYAPGGALASVTLPGDGVVQFRATADGSIGRVTDPDGNLAVANTYGTGGRVSRQEYAAGPPGATTRFTVAGGLIMERTNADGYSTAYTYDGAGNLTAVTSPLGEVTHFSYDDAGNRVQATTPSGATIRCAYDSAGRVIGLTDPAGGQRSFRYSAAGLLQSATDPTGATTSFAYDAAGNRTGITDPLGRTTAFGYDATGNLTSVTDPAGAVTTTTTTTTYDAPGQLITVTDPVGAVFTCTYDADGNHLTGVSPSGTTRYGYDARGKLISVTGPAGATIRYTYDPGDRLTSVTGPDGATWRVTYDAAGNAVTLTDPAGAVTTQAWTPAGQLARVTDPLGRARTCTRDGNGRLVTLTDPGGGVTGFGYDGDGRPIFITTPAGLTTRFEYDAAGRVSALVDPRGWIIRFRYNARGQQTEVIRPSGATHISAYDAAGQLTEVIDANGSVTRYGYDGAGYLSQITDAKGAVTRLAHDANGRQISSTDPLGRTTQCEYDHAGNLVAVIDPAGHTVHTAYDAGHRPIRRAAEDAEAVSFGYDESGRLTSMADATGTTQYAYDHAGRLTSITGPEGAVFSFRYDAAGQRTGLRYPDGLELAYRYDLNGRLVGLHDSRAGDAAYALDLDGRLITEQLPGRFARRYHYGGGLLDRFLVIRDGHPVAETSFIRDPDGRVLLQRDGRLVRGFRYDPAGQLVYAGTRGGPGAGSTELAYDAVGNRVRMRHGELETHYRYDDADQLVALETRGRRAEFRYDSSGRLTEEVEGERRRTIRYDGFGLPVTVTQTGDGRAERTQVTYDGSGLATSVVLTAENGRREEELAASIRYRWSSGQVPQILSQRAGPSPDDAECDRPGRLDADFSYGYGRTFASGERGAASFHRDASGSAIRTEDTEDWAQAHRYSAFGEPEDDDPDRDGRGERRDPVVPGLPRFGYRGELSLGGMVYLRGRAYDTRLGRFLSRGPVAVTGGPGRAGNPYVYAANDPVDHADPLGRLAAGVGSVITGIEDVGAQVLGQAASGCHECQHPGDGIGAHPRCFQGTACPRARRWLTAAPGALWASPAERNGLWDMHLPERAAQGFTIAQLDWNREGRWPSPGHELIGPDVPVSVTMAATVVPGAFGYTGVSLAVGGAGRTAGRLAGGMRPQREVIRAAPADVGWAGVTSQGAAPRTTGMLGSDPTGRDEFDAGPMWYQVLPRAQLERLGGLPPGAVELASGRFELTSGEPEQWMPGHRGHDAARACARHILPV